MTCNEASCINACVSLHERYWSAWPRSLFSSQPPNVNGPITQSGEFFYCPWSPWIFGYYLTYCVALRSCMSFSHRISFNKLFLSSACLFRFRWFRAFLHTLQHWFRHLMDLRMLPSNQVHLFCNSCISKARAKSVELIKFPDYFSSLPLNSFSSAEYMALIWSLARALLMFSVH